MASLRKQSRTGEDSASLADLQTLRAAVEESVSKQREEVKNINDVLVHLSKGVEEALEQENAQRHKDVTEINSVLNHLANAVDGSESRWMHEYTQRVEQRVRHVERQWLSHAWNGWRMYHRLQVRKRNIMLKVRAR
eukprot:SAG31_NODE_7188_length_1762_cov_1.308479_2_plen_135_part_01